MQKIETMNNLYRAAAIDVGSNSVKMAIGEINEYGNINILYEASINSRIGENIESTGKIQQTALDRTIEALTNHLAAAANYNIESLRIVSTNAMRDASNSGEVLSTLNNRLGVDVEIISGETEAKYAYSAITNDPIFGIDNENSIIADIGGGSSEIILGNKTDIISSASIPIGAVRVSELFLNEFPTSYTAIKDARNHIKSMIKDNATAKKANKMICIGGSSVNTGRIIYSISLEQTREIHGKEISENKLIDTINHISGLNLDDRKKIIGLEPKRADIILGGMLIIQQILESYHLDSFNISIRGLRHALLFEMLQTHR